jgi:hypothetical protein
VSQRDWKNRGKYGGNWTQVEELEIGLRILREAREEEERRRDKNSNPGKDKNAS